MKKINNNEINNPPCGLDRTEITINSDTYAVRISWMVKNPSRVTEFCPREKPMIFQYVLPNDHDAEAILWHMCGIPSGDEPQANTIYVVLDEHKEEALHCIFHGLDCAVADFCKQELDYGVSV